MLSGIKLALVMDQSRVERISEDVVQGALVQWLSSRILPPNGQISPFVVGAVRDLRDGKRPGEHEVPHFPYEVESLRIGDDCLFHAVVQVSLRRHRHGSSTTYLSFHSALRVAGKVEDELGRHSGFHAEEKARFHACVTSARRYDFRDFSSLKHVLDRGPIHGISREPVEAPTKYSVDPAFFDRLHHFLEFRPRVGDLRGFLVDIDFPYLYFFDFADR